MSIVKIAKNTVTRLRPSPLVTISGTVKDEFGSPLMNRTVRAYLDESFMNSIGTAYSGSDGTFSLVIPGLGGSTIVLVAQGESGENCQIFSKIGESV